MEDLKKDNAINRNKKIKKLIINFFIVMIILTFFSNTINNFSLPKVTIENPVSGLITKEISGSGIIEPKECVKLYGESKVVEEVRAKVGDKVSKDELLIIFKKEDLEPKLREETIKFNQSSLGLEQLRNENIYKQKVLERKIEEAKQKMDSENKNLDIVSKLLKDGYESQVNFDKQSTIYNDAKRTYEQVLDDYNNDLKSQENSIKKAEYNLEMQKAQIDKISKDINSSSDINSPCDGIIAEINIEKGQRVDGVKPVIIINNVSKGFQFRMSMHIENLKYLAKEDKVDINIKTSEVKKLEGKIKEIVDSTGNKDGKKDLIINIEQGDFVGGENGEGFISKEIASCPIVVANSAINTDKDGKFVWVVKEKKGTLGNQYFLKKVQVSIGESDSTKTAILDGISEEDKVVMKVEDDKGVSDGSCVTVKN